MGPAAIVLAAGRSERMGRPKALLDFRGQPFIVRILQALEALDVKLRVVVLGPDAPRIRPVLAAHECLIIEPPPPRPPPPPPPPPLPPHPPPPPPARRRHGPISRDRIAQGRPSRCATVASAKRPGVAGGSPARTGRHHRAPARRARPYRGGGGGPDLRRPAWPAGALGSGALRRAAGESARRAQRRRGHPGSPWVRRSRGSGGRSRGARRSQHAPGL